MKTSVALRFLKPELTGSVTPSEIIRLFSNGPWTLGSRFQYRFHDSRYASISPRSLGKFMRSCYVDDMHYRKQAFDCDNFASLTAAISSYWLGCHTKKADPNDPDRVYCGSFMGTCVIPGHMVNYAIVRDSENKPPIILFFEPQNDKIFSQDIVSKWKIKDIIQS